MVLGLISWIIFLVCFIQLSFQDCSSDFAGYQHTCAIITSQQVKCWGDNTNGTLGVGDEDDRGDELGEMGDNLSFTDLNGSVTQISAGSFSNCAQLTSLDVKCWGDGDKGRLGYGSISDLGDDDGEMGSNLPVVDFGSGVIVRKIVNSYLSSCILTTDDKVKCWGYNGYGQLGYGDEEDRGDGSNEMGCNIYKLAK